MRKINYKSDFKLEEKKGNSGVPDFTIPFRFSYYCRGKSYIASYHDGKYTNCRPFNGGNLLVIFDSHNLGMGNLLVKREYFLSDEDFHDGIWHIMSEEDTGVLLHGGATEEVGIVKGEPIPAYMVGPQGETGPQGPQGDALTYDTMTDEQKDDLAGRVPLDDINQEITTLTKALDGEVTRALAAEADLQTQIDDTKAVNASQEQELKAIAVTLGEQLAAYGIEFDTTISDPVCTRIGNSALHKTLPVQSLMRGCLLDDDGNVVEYLPKDDWTSATRDGSRGQVMVEIPKHYRRCVTNGNIHQVWISPVALSGFLEVPTMYISAYEAMVSSGKLFSVCNGNYTYTSGILPSTNISRTAFRTYARNRNSAATAEWNGYLYEAHKALWWLFAVEYATRDSQQSYNAELDINGYHQGGLGPGVTTLTGTEWGAFNGYAPFVPCGITDGLGNGTGTVSYTATNASGTSLPTVSVPRYRGIENPFGHIWKWTDGINIRISADTANGSNGLSMVYTCSNPAYFTDDSYTNYVYVGDEARTDGWVRSLIFGEGGEIIPSAVGGGSTTHFCDYHYTSIPDSGESLRSVMFGGYAGGSVYSGFGYARSYNVPSDTAVDFGSRLCFLPNT